MASADMHSTAQREHKVAFTKCTDFDIRIKMLMGRSVMRAGHPAQNIFQADKMDVLRLSHRASVSAVEYA
jgi:hypothetical protein